MSANSSTSQVIEADDDQRANDAMRKLWGQIKVKDTLHLRQDFYSLAFYGFYLEDDEEDLSIVTNVEQIKNQLNQANRLKTQARNSKMTDDIDEDEILDFQNEDNDPASSSYQPDSVKSSFSPYDKKQFLLKIKKQWREQRNLKNFYKIELVFGF